MKLNAPKVVTFWICVALIILGVVGYFIPATAHYALWLAVAGGAVLAVACATKGL